MNEPLMAPAVRKRILMFYFAAGINIVMAMYVLAMGSGSNVSGGLLGLIALVFLAFAFVNFYFAKMLRKRWEAQVRALQPPDGAPDQRVNE